MKRLILCGNVLLTSFQKLAAVRLLLPALFLAVSILATGCAGTIGSYVKKGGPFVVKTEFNDDLKCYLLSIRDSGIVVAPVAKTSTGFDQRLTQFIHYNNILKLQHSGLGGFGLPGALGGMAAGGIAGYIVGIEQPMSIHGKTGFERAVDVITLAPSRAFSQMIVYIGGGAALGGLTGGALFAPQSTFDVSKREDINTLITLCLYCGDEPEYVRAVK